MTKYRIAEVNNHKGTGMLYVLVQFWLDSQTPGADSAYQTQDFIMDIQPTITRVIRDAQGRWLKSDGTWIDPWSLTEDERAKLQFQRETVANDVLAEMHANIESYWVRESNKPRSKSLESPKTVRDAIDARGVLVAAKVEEGKVFIR